MSLLTHAGSRRGPRAAGIALAALAVVAGTYVASGLRPIPAPVRPAVRAAAAPAVDASAGRTPLDAGSAPNVSLDQVDHSIGAWSKNLAANPHDYLAATNLAILYQGRGRLSYDLSDYQRSLDAARQALTIEPTDVEARLAEASTLVSLHDFDKARTTADEILVDVPGAPAALAVRFDALLELGRIDDARRDLAVLKSTGGPAILIREARLACVTGDAARALQLATQARKAAVDDEVQDLGIYDYAVGEYARLAGDALTARTGYEAALEIRPTDVGALIGLARIDAFEGTSARAIDGLRRATGIAPQPEALALLGDLLQDADPADRAATKSFDTIRFIEQLGDIQATTYDRQLLRFEVDHGGANDALLGRVRTSVEARPNAAGHDLLAWTLYRLGRPTDAAGEIVAARALGADDARLRFHEGAIRIALGDEAVGRELVESAVDMGPALDPAERQEAARLLPR
ncbi:MAG TPA: tetratricopeptide repeat protein [Candidatus Limnocylindrales bacterium]|nr:tetratricopeptide repeat protein [Candidatus Limnocylindrales bacterium]